MQYGLIFLSLGGWGKRQLFWPELGSAFELSSNQVHRQGDQDHICLAELDLLSMLRSHGFSCVIENKISEKKKKKKKKKKAQILVGVGTRAECSVQQKYSMASMLWRTRKYSAPLSPAILIVPANYHHRK